MKHDNNLKNGFGKFSKSVFDFSRYLAQNPDRKITEQDDGHRVDNRRDERGRHNCRVEFAFFCKQGKHCADEFCYQYREEHGKAYHRCGERTALHGI